MDPPTSDAASWLLDFLTQFSAAGFGALLGALAAFYFTRRDDHRRQRGRALAMLAEIQRIKRTLATVLRALNQLETEGIVPPTTKLSAWCEGLIEQLAEVVPGSVEPLIGMQHYLEATCRHAENASLQDETHITSLQKMSTAATTQEREVHAINARSAMKLFHVALGQLQFDTRRARQQAGLAETGLRSFLTSRLPIDRLLGWGSDAPDQLPR